MLPNAIFKNGPIFLFIFVLFSLQFQYKLKKRRLCAWDSNLGMQDGMRIRNHRAMAAPHILTIQKVFKKLNHLNG